MSNEIKIICAVWFAIRIGILALVAHWFAGCAGPHYDAQGEGAGWGDAIQRTATRIVNGQPLDQHPPRIP